jgi:hypothetical protein
MKSRPIALCFLFIGGLLSAQTQTAATAATTTAPMTPSLTALVTAQQVRSVLVASIVNGSMQANAALVQLQGLTAPMGLPVDPAADFGYAAIDVGHRLIAAGSPVAAGVFFRAAETSLASVVLQTPDAQAWNKAQFLQQLALIRDHYLNNPVQAMADIKQAIALQPNDAWLQQEKAMFVNEHGDLFTGATQNG